MGWKHPDHAPDRWPTLDGGSFAVKPSLIHTDNHILRHLAAAGHGIAFVPEADADDPLVSAADLETVLPDVVGRVVTAQYSVPRMLADTPRVKLILEAVRAFMSNI